MALVQSPGCDCIIVLIEGVKHLNECVFIFSHGFKCGQFQVPFRGLFGNKT